MIVKTESELQILGADLVQKYKTGALIFLSGELGAGKTTLVRGALRALGVNYAVKSPTYTIVETYHLPEITIQHFDLYRLHNMEELEATGFRDYMNKHDLVFIEWPEQAGEDNLPTPDCAIEIRYHPQGREVEII